MTIQVIQQKLNIITFRIYCRSVVLDCISFSYLINWQLSVFFSAMALPFRTFTQTSTNTEQYKHFTFFFFYENEWKHKSRVKITCEFGTVNFPLR